MANPKNAKPNEQERYEEKRKEHFPEVPTEMLWVRNQNKGYATIPRTMPLVMHGVDMASMKLKGKGEPAGDILLNLWARTRDHAYMVIDTPDVLAAEARFKGPKAAGRWRAKMKTLVELGFIVTKEGDAGPYHHVLLLNPNKVMVRLFHKGLISEDLYRRFADRCEKIGAKREINEELDSINESTKSAGEESEGGAA